MKLKANILSAASACGPYNNKHRAKKGGKGSPPDIKGAKPLVRATMAVVTVVGAGMLAIRLLKKRGKEETSSHSAAFEKGETDSENFDQTRAAGTAAMRDEPHAWDAVDEALDSSFPSSDPPSFNPGVA